jgi:Uma2 family endonuclease
MSALKVPRLTVEEYLCKDRIAEFKSEFVDGELFPLQGPGGPMGMAGARYVHNLVKDNFAFEIRSRLKDGPCTPLTSDMRTKAHGKSIYYYPDVVVVCDAPEFEDSNDDILLNPKVVIEVLSDSTESYDRGTKARNYREIPSVQEVILISPNRVDIEQYSKSESGTWILKSQSDINGEVELASLSIRIPIANLYRKVNLQTE